MTAALALSLLLVAAPAIQDAPPAAAPPAAARQEPSIANAKLTADDLVALAAKDDEWLFEEKLACRSSGANKLWEGTLIDAALGAPARKEFQTIDSGVDSDTILYLEFDGPVPPAWRKALNEKLWSGAGQPTYAQPELVGQAGKLVVVLSCSLTSRIRAPVGHFLRTRFGMRFPDKDAAHEKLYVPLENALQGKKPDPAGLEFAKAHEAELAPLSWAAFLIARIHAGNEEHELAAKAYARAFELDQKGDPLPGDGAACDALEGIGMAAYHQKKWPEAIAGLQACADYAGTLGRADRQSGALYNLACSAALGGQPEAAVAALKAAFALPNGKRFKPQARKDEDLKSLQERDDFKEIVK